MADLVCTQNNGVIAVMSVRDYNRIKSGEFDLPNGGTDWALAVAAGVRIFTFTTPDRIKRQRETSKGVIFFTGDFDDWKHFQQRHLCKGGPIYVPFSRGPLHYKGEMFFVASKADFHAVFGEKAWTVRFPASNTGEKE